MANFDVLQFEVWGFEFWLNLSYKINLWAHFCKAKISEEEKKV